jgi:riboflavin synthase
MFTGIIEDLGKLVKIEENGTNISFWIESKLVNELKIDQSVSHNGTCLTIEAIENNNYRVTAVAETLKVTNLQHWKLGSIINLERCVAANGRFDGHFVSGHVDAMAKCIFVTDKNGSWEYQFEFDEKFATNIIEKGSICINGISLTIFNVGIKTFTVAIIPYTYNHTNLHLLKENDMVNVEFDMIGKYIKRIELIGKR